MLVFNYPPARHIHYLELDYSGKLRSLECRTYAVPEGSTIRQVFQLVESIDPVRESFLNRNYIHIFNSTTHIHTEIGNEHNQAFLESLKSKDLRSSIMLKVELEEIGKGGLKPDMKNDGEIRSRDALLIRIQNDTDYRGLGKFYLGDLEGHWVMKDVKVEAIPEDYKLA